jgi:hypothetical protein
MKLSNLFASVPGAVAAPASVATATPAKAARIGGVTLAVGVANDVAAPANDAGVDARTAFYVKRALEKRIDRLSRRDGRSF